MRNGFRSSRGAMRGTIGGVPICRVGVVGFATVAIGIGPFVCSIYSITSAFTWPNSEAGATGFPASRLPRTFSCFPYMHYGTRGSRSGEAHLRPETEWRAFYPHASRKSDRAPSDVPAGGHPGEYWSPRMSALQW